MSDKKNPLEGLAGWLNAPSMIAGGLAAALAISYGMLTVQLVPGTEIRFLELAVSVALVAVFLGSSYNRRKLKTIAALGKGEVSPNVGNLSTAIGEARSHPDRAFLTDLFLWVCGATTIGLLYWGFVPEAKVSSALQIAWIGALLGPLSAALPHVLVIGRSRTAVERIASMGLLPHQVIVAAPATRSQLRRRLMIFISVLVLTPAILVADLTIRRTSASVQALIEKNGRATEAQLRQQSRKDFVEIELLGAVVMLVALVEALIAARALVRPMRTIANYAARIANGEVADLPLVIAEDEVWAASTAFAAMRSELRSVVNQLQRAGAQLSSGSTQLVQTSRSNEAGAAEQAASLNETSATTEELARSARQIAENAASVAEIAQQTYAAAQNGQRSSDAFQASMARMREGNQAIADSVVKLNKRVQQIGKIVEFINEIADKSDLLALNAELEGNKAGEVGRGFSLVAAEMRRLAENVLTSTREIERLISEVRDATNAAVMATEAGVKATDAGAQLATRVSSHLQMILELARQTSDAVRAISLATQQQQTGTDQLASAMADILHVTEQSAQASRQMASANDDLSSLSTDLTSVVARFKVDAAP
ncbi:MAG: methyl-accepting chemotaxis protein [Myxococcaceae bacterium]